MAPGRCPLRSTAHPPASSLFTWAGVGICLKSEAGRQPRQDLLWPTLEAAERWFQCGLCFPPGGVLELGKRARERRPGELGGGSPWTNE